MLGTPFWVTQMDRTEGLQHNRSGHVSEDLRNIAQPRVKKAFTMLGANSKHEGETERACRSPILLRDVIAKRNKAFKVEIFLKPH